MDITTGIEAILSMQNPTVRKGMQSIIQEFYTKNNLPNSAKLEGEMRKQLCTKLADYLLKGVESNGKSWLRN